MPRSPSGCAALRAARHVDRRHQSRRLRRSRTPGCSTGAAARCIGKVSPRSPNSFRAIRTTSDIFVVDGNRRTCSGGTAALDMMLHLITEREGRALASDVSEQFIHPRIRGTQDPQRMAVQSRLGVANEKLIAAIGIMEATHEDPRPVHDIAADVGLVAATARAPVRQIPAGEPEPALSEAAARTCANDAAADDEARARRRGGVRLRVGVALQPLLSERIRASAARRAGDRLTACPRSPSAPCLIRSCEPRNACFDMSGRVFARRRCLPTDSASARM